MIKKTKAADDLTAQIVELALDKKAENVISINIKEITTLTDSFIICSADTDVQVKAIPPFKILPLNWDLFFLFLDIKDLRDLFRFIFATLAIYYSCKYCLKNDLFLIGSYLLKN